MKYSLVTNLMYTTCALSSPLFLQRCSVFPFFLYCRWLSTIPCEIKVSKLPSYASTVMYSVDMNNNNNNSADDF